MKAFFKGLGNWIKTHKVLSIIIAVILVSISIITPILLCKKNNTNKPITLANNQCLVIGATRYVNKEITTTETITKTVPLTKTYTLLRSSSSSSTVYNPITGGDFTPNYVKCSDGYYYYWITTEKTTEIEIAKLQTTTITEYSYLPYKQNESVLLLTKTTTKKKHIGQTGWQQQNFTYTINFNGYSTSMDDLTTFSAELAFLIDTSGVTKYYLSPDIPDSETYSQNTFDTYYYIERTKI